MIRKCILVFLLLSLIFCYIWPKLILADVQLSREDSNNLINLTQKGIVEKWVDLTSSSVSYPEKQAALYLIKNAVQQKGLRYNLKELPREFLEKAVKIAVSLVISPEAVVILEKLEKESVDKTVDTAMDWFLQNEIKIDSGKLSYSFNSYKGNVQDPFFYYNLAYHPTDDKNGKLIVEFYSPEEIEPEKSNCSSILWLKLSCWDFDYWRAQGNEKIPPFVIRIQGDIKKETEYIYIWKKTLSVEISFSEPMPEFPEEDKILEIPFLGSYYKEWSEKISKTMALLEKMKGSSEESESIASKVGGTITSIKNSLGNAAGKIQSFFSKINPFSPATISEAPVFSDQEIKISSFEDVEEIIEEVIELDQKIEEIQLIEDKLKLPEVNLADLQEQLDDITESIDEMNQKIAELTMVNGDSQNQLIEIEEIKNEEEEIKEELKETLEVVLCEKLFPALAAENKVIFNEIAWMGTKNSSNDEWVELYNNSSSSIDLSGWRLKASDGTPEILLSGIISPNGYFLLERTDDQVISDISADLIYTGALFNSGEKLELRDSSNNLIDKINCSSGWFAGRNYNNEGNWIRMSMERVSPNSLEEASNWMTSDGLEPLSEDINNNPVLGTPRVQNSRYHFSETEVALSLNHDLIFTEEGSPYIISGYLGISEGITLIIEPGTVIEGLYKYKYNSRIEVRGVLKAIGTSDKKITFRSTLKENGLPGSWSHISFLGSGSVLENVIVKHGGWFSAYPFGAKAVIMIDNADITIRDSLIEENVAGGVWMYNSSSTIEDTLFRDNNKEYFYEYARWPMHGLTVALYIDPDSNPNLVNLTFEGNTVNIYPE